MIVRYGRISTIKQNSDSQEEEGVDSFIDKGVTGTKKFAERPRAKKLMAFLKKNPTAKTIVKDLSRLGRSSQDVVQTVDWFNDNNYELEIENLKVNTKTPQGRMMITMLSAVYELELNFIRERTQRGREIGKIKGNYKGRKRGAKASDESILKKHPKVVDMLKAGMTVYKTAKILEKNRGTVKRVETILKGSIEHRQTNIIEQIELQQNK